MTEVKYTVRGHELYELNPEFVTDLEKITDTLYSIIPKFPDGHRTEDSVTIMHGKKSEEDIKAINPWANVLFKGTLGTYALIGMLVTTTSGQAYVNLDPQIPTIARTANIQKYSMDRVENVSDVHIKGQGIQSLILDRGLECDSLTLELTNNAKIQLLYQSGSFNTFRVNQSTSKGVESNNYILEDVDPSVYNAKFFDSAEVRRDKLFSRVPINGTLTRPLLKDSKISFQPINSLNNVTASPGDQYLVLFETDDRRQAQLIHKKFINALEKPLELYASSDKLDNYLKELNTKRIELPSFAVNMNHNPQKSLTRYGLTVTTLTTGAFTNQNDFRTLINGLITDANKGYKISKIQIL